MTVAELMQRLKERRIPPEDFLVQLKEHSDGSELGIKTYGPGEMSLYRTKIVERVPEAAQELSYPPKEKAELARANRDGEQVFYASAKLPMTLAESRVKAGDRVVVSKWKNAKELQVRVIPTEAASDSERLYNLLFTDPATSIYPYSAAVAHALFEQAPLTGLLYPSKLDEEENDNVALSRQATDELLIFAHASLYEVLEAEEDGTFKVKELDFVTPGGKKLDWKGRSRRWPVPKEELRAKWNGWGYDCYDKTGALVEPI